MIGVLALLLLPLSLAVIVPGNVPGLVPGSAEAAAWWSARLSYADKLAAIPATPGDVPGLLPGSTAAKAYWEAQYNHAAQLGEHQAALQAAHLHPVKRQADLVPGTIPGLVPGSEAARQWWTNRLIWAGQHAQHAHHVNRRHVAAWPAGVSAAACPNYPYCGAGAAVPAGYSNTAGYPTGVSA